MKIAEAKDIIEEKLISGGIKPGRDAQELLLFGLGKERLKDTETSLNEGELQILNDLVRRRLDHEPLQYIIGEWDFYGKTYAVGEGVLIPRPDTETLVERVIEDFKGKEDLTVVDLCAGTGCIGYTLEKKLKAARVIEIEKSEQAFCYLEKNRKKRRSSAELILGDIFDEAVLKRFPRADIITCNPPYLKQDDFLPVALQPELRFEPFEALYGGVDGLDYYAAIARSYKGILKPEGRIYFEIGINQEEEVMRSLVQNGYTNVRKYRDLGGIYRVVAAGVSEQYA